jgi:PilZ domain
MIMQQNPSYSRRFFSRAKTREGVWVYWRCKGREETSQVRDLSLGGLFVETAMRTALGTSVKLDFLVEEGQIRAEGVVRRVESRGLGLKFSAIADEDKKRLKTLVARLRK